MIKRNGKQLTPNQMAKHLVMENGGGAVYWEERIGWDLDAMTEREREAISAAVHKQIERVEKLLGVDYTG